MIVNSLGPYVAISVHDHGIAARPGVRMRPRLYGPVRRMCRLRGPCTPSTRMSSMSLVAEGTEMRVCGRAASSRANASAQSAASWGDRCGQVGGDVSRLDHDQVEVGHQGERAPTLAGAVVQDDRAGLGDR